MGIYYYSQKLIMIATYQMNYFKLTIATISRGMLNLMGHL